MTRCKISIIKKRFQKLIFEFDNMIKLNLVI